ncbi:DUF1768 domain-containing protein [Caenorhabditis elegans]|nr:DUF1768 domain-containing protein [Caenorhabditis elegans]CCD66956.1 DUF1768 domain-containing protein [Caenorhabditis elegans]|eukprot:NP_001256093.1 Uncharacterized protein CELE_C37C3.1 [Caenorhabditis elegans]
MQAAQWAPLSSGKNLLGKILDGIREELWDDSNYKDEREEVEKRMETERDYLFTAIEHMDLMYKERATKRVLLFEEELLTDDRSYITPDIQRLLPDWAWPPILVKNEPIQPSLPVIIDFPRSSPLRAAEISRRKSTSHSTSLSKRRYLRSRSRSLSKSPARRRSRHLSRSGSRTPAQRHSRRSESTSRRRSGRHSRSRSRSPPRKRPVRRSRSRSRSRTPNRNWTRARSRTRSQAKSSSTLTWPLSPSRSRSNSNERNLKEKKDRKKKKSEKKRKHHSKSRKHRSKRSESREERHRRRKEKKREKKKKRRRRSSTTSD